MAAGASGAARGVRAVGNHMSDPLGVMMSWPWGIFGSWGSAPYALPGRIAFTH